MWPLAGWQLYVHRGGAWTNPLSSDAGGPAETANGESGPAPAPGANTPANTPASTAGQRVPDAVRVQLALAPGQALAGSLQSDWVRPVFTTPRP